MFNLGVVVNNTRNRETCFKQVLRFLILVSVLSNRSPGFGEFDVESDIRISNRSRLHIGMNISIPHNPISILQYSSLRAFKQILAYSSHAI